MTRLGQRYLKNSINLGDSILGSRSAIEDIASIFGTDVSQEDAGSGEGAVEHMYRAAEPVFGAVAHKMVEMGWSVFPQEMNGNRRPGTVGGEMIKWSEDHKLSTQKPMPAVLDLWAKQCASLNVAVVFGPASGNTFMIDMDIVEQELSQQVQELATRILGDTRLQRVGRWPKMAFVYRHDPEDEIPSRSLHFVQSSHPENPDGEEQLIEIISTGKPMTFYGKHHKTGRYFKWVHGSPMEHGPESVPLVTSAQVGDFLDAVDSIRPFTKSASFDMQSVSWEWDENAKVHKPRIRSHSTASDWTENEEGKVADGREAYLTRVAMRTVQANQELVGSEQGRAILVGTVLEIFTETAETTGRWRGNQLLNEVKSKVMRFAHRMMKGDLKPSAPMKDSEGKYVTSANARGYVPAQPRKAGGDSLDFLPPFADPTDPSFEYRKVGKRRPMRIGLVESTPSEIERRRAERQISEDRTEVAKAVSDGLLKAFNAFWDEVYDKTQTHSRVHILKAPTGAGKTSRGINFIAGDPRTKEPYTIYGDTGEIVHEGQSPILVLMPTYANIEELRDRARVLNLDPKLSDKALMEQAREELGLEHVSQLEGRLEDLRRDAMKAGLKTMLYQGKLRAGCKMKEKVEMAMAAGLGTSALCHTEEQLDKNTREVKKPEKFCQFYHDYDGDGSGRKCPAIEQKEKIAECHVVFLPHAFLALSIPEELKNVRAVVADERIHHLFLHTATFEMDVFATPRKNPVLTKAEREQGVEADEFAKLRQNAVDEAIYALKTDLDPAETLLKKAEELGQKGFETVDRWISAALRCCSASMARDETIDPEISSEALAEICAKPTGVAVREESRFWKIVQERYEMRKGEKVLEGLLAQDGKEYTGRQTKGRKDARIQLLRDEIEDGIFKETIRISWRETPNWVERPLLLLDASAAPEMIKKIWDGKEVVVHDIPAPLNVRIVGVADRTYSNASVVAKPNASAREKVQSAKLLANVRKAISVISAYYGFSRVVAGGSILARQAVNTNWEGPHNVDWCHFGAMRGLDFAKYHAAAISVGRMELPIRVIDGLVAALTYDDDVPEQPYDKYGTGMTEAGQTLLIPSKDQLVRMRSGHDLLMPVPMFPGKWGRMIQKQYREEELLQFLGRLRPVYREGDAPIWFSLSSIIPEEVVVDDLINIDDLVRRNGKETCVWDAMRRCQGVLDIEVATKSCEDLFGAVEATIRQFRTEGLDPTTGEIEPRVAWSVVALKWTDEKGRSGYSFARADIADPEEALRNAHTECGLSRLTSVEKVSQSRGQTSARGRVPDKIENELGPMAERREREERQQTEVAVKLLMTTRAESIANLKAKKTERQVPVMLPTGVPRKEDDEDAGDIMSNLIEIEAGASIEALWRAKGYGRERQGAAETFLPGDGTVGDGAVERMGASTNDRSQEFDLYRFDEVDGLIPY